MTLSRAGSRSQSEPSTESLADALTALCAEVGIPCEEMLHTVEVALATAYIRAFNPPGDVRVTLDTKTGALEVTSRVVRGDGSEMVRTLPSEDFKRMAAQTAKHAVLRHIHDLERDKGLRDVAEHRGELATGIVDRSEAGTVYVDLGRAEAVMPPEEQIPGELLSPGRPLLAMSHDHPHNPAPAQRSLTSRPTSRRCGWPGRAMRHRRLDDLPTVGEAGPDAKRPGRVGPRPCVACRLEADKRSLVRVVRKADGGAAIDLTRR